MKKEKVNNWKVALVPNERVVSDGFCAKSAQEIAQSPYTVIPATVPGCMELDMINAGLLDKDIYYGTNVLKLQELEGTHLWYYTHFQKESNGLEAFLEFEGIDTAAEIFVDGALLGTTENMLIAHSFDISKLENGEHELVVHIIPACVYVRAFELPAKARGFDYNHDSLLIRKAPYMFGWDIMPRIVSAGLWRDVNVVYKETDRIDDLFVYTGSLDLINNNAVIEVAGALHTNANCVEEFAVKITGECGDSRFEKQKKLYSFNFTTKIFVDSPKLWWPKNYGDPELYNVTITLLRNGKNVFEKTVSLGIRTVELERTSIAGPNGKFCFKVNGRKIFVLGTNWVPADALPCRNDEYTMRGLELAQNLGCNMLRIWGGGTYPSDMLYDYCDSHGILVWQDFGMACGFYPQNDRFKNLLYNEAVSLVKRLRNHASMALWSGDNECDMAITWKQVKLNGKPIFSRAPEKNLLTRQILDEVTTFYDGSRPYLPSSPYMDAEAIACLKPSEDHLWGPRDYFKGDFYNKNSVCHFASETGYHGCPSPESLKQFMDEDSLTDFGNGEKCTNAQWLVHAASPETDENAPWVYRIPLMVRQVERLFGKDYGTIEEFALKSQISQAEAVKFFIEHFRIQKWYRTGIIWWNVIDGWPQISDAVVDWYGRKKIAYEYIKRSQQPIALMCDEPDENGKINLVAVNDGQEDTELEYTVTEALSGTVVLSGICTAKTDSATKVGELEEKPDSIYIISYNGKNVNGINHFVCDIGSGLNLKKYVEFMKAAGLYEKLEGFE